METSKQDSLYEEASAEFSGAISRVARAYEADSAQRLELRQEIHIALWRSLDGFDGRCSLRTWVYRIAHNISASHVLKSKRLKAHGLVSLNALELEPIGESADVDRQMAFDRLLRTIQRLKPLDRQVISLYLEGDNAASIGEITGLSARNVAVKVHRIKNLLSRQFGESGGRHADSQ